MAAHVDTSTTMPQFPFSAWFRHARTGVASGAPVVGRTTVLGRGGSEQAPLAWPVRGS
jgi:hypothetical protein